MQFLYVAIIAFLGSLIQGTSGFGFALVCMSLLPLFIAFKTAVVLEAVLAFVMVSYMTIRMYKYVDLKLILPPAISAGIFSYFGISTLISLNDMILKRIFGIVLIVLALYLVFISDRIRIKGSLASGLGVGMISGFAGGLFGVGGPPMVVYFLATTDDKMEYIANTQAFFTINSLTVIVIHIIKKNFTQDMFLVSLAALVGVIGGTISGMYLFKKMNIITIKYIICLLMVVSGIYMTVKA